MAEQQAQGAVLFADVSGSTRLYETAGDQVAKAAIDDCVRIMRERTEAAKGRVIKTIGDEVMSLFPTADAAADAAIQMQEGINELKPVGNTKIGIRIGFNYGPVVEQADGDIFGDAVNVASRLSHVAVKGQIITARDTVMMMAPMLKSATRKITAIQIKGKATEVEVYELMWQQSEDATTMAAARSVYKPRKTTLRLDLKGRVVTLSSERIEAHIGRDPDADFVLQDPRTSRAHARIERRLDKYVLVDHSDAGTFVTVEGDGDVVLRREEFTLRGRGWIAFGQSRTSAAEILSFSCEGDVGAASVLAEEKAAKRGGAEKSRKEAEALAKAKAEVGARARKEAESAEREAELKKRRDESPKARKPMRAVAIAIVAVVAVGAVWYYFNKGSLEKQAALTTALEQAAKATDELKAAQAEQQAALKKLEEQRAAELAAIKAGDQAKIREAQEAARRAEAEAVKQAEAIKAREAAATDARKKAQDAAGRAKQQSKGPELAPEAPEQQAKAPVPAPNAPEPVAKALEPPLVKAPEPVAKSAEPQRAKSRSEREREEDDRLARAVASKPSTQVAASAPSASSAPAASAPPLQTAELLQQAQAMEASDPRGAVKIYRSLARNGSGAAAKRLGEIYDKGIAGISRDYAESLQWYETARKLGETIERSGPRAEAVPAQRPEEPATSAAVQPAPSPAPPVVAAIPEAAKSAPLVSAPPRPAPAPVAKPAQTPELVSKAEPASAPIATAAPEAPKAAAPPLPQAPAKAASPPPAPEPEAKSGWFFTRGIWIALLVIAFVAWRRYRRRQKKAARKEQRALDAASNRAMFSRKSNAPPAERQAAVAQPVARQGDGTLFVSYSHKDRPRVEPIVSVIEEMGRRVWMDRSDITGKTGWAGQIVRAIRECHAVVLMASPNSYSSDQVVRELYLAMNHKKTIVPIEIEPAEMPDELQYILAPFHHHRLSGGEPRQVIGRALAAV